MIKEQFFSEPENTSYIYFPSQFYWKNIRNQKRQRGQIREVWMEKNRFVLKKLLWNHPRISGQYIYLKEHKKSWFKSIITSKNTILSSKILYKIAFIILPFLSHFTDLDKLNPIQFFKLIQLPKKLLNSKEVKGDSKF